MRRFEQYILPKRFTKIRTYGYLANRNRQRRINEILKKLNLPQHKGLAIIPIVVRMQERYGIAINEYPCCHENTLELLKVFYPWKQTDDG
ncbi:MAG: transposase [Bacteroidetes bacterium]|nr:transposase [Bacteroidota bacterium]